jgi:hypothetical protein
MQVKPEKTQNGLPTTDPQGTLHARRSPVGQELTEGVVMLKQQPPDEWSFLRPDVLTDDGDVEALQAAEVRAPEEAALHVDHADRLRSANDPGRAEVAIDPDVNGAPPVVSYFDDEEPEVSATPWERRDGNSSESIPDPDDATARADNEDGSEPDLEDILESQHYAFGPEEGDATAPT